MSDSDWIVTRSGIEFDLLNPTPAMVRIEDIAHALGNLCRFNGHTSAFYSVAQHSVIVAGAVPPDERLEALLHDASEAYIGDMVRPLKRRDHFYQETEKRIMAVIAEKFGLKPMSPRIKWADERALATERRDLIAPTTRPWGTLEDSATPFDQVIKPYPPDLAIAYFLEAYGLIKASCFLEANGLIAAIDAIQEATQ